MILVDVNILIYATNDDSEQTLPQWNGSTGNSSDRRQWDCRG